MSRETPIGLTILEKLFGLLMMAIGGLTVYSTYTNLGSTGALPALYLAGGAAIVIIGFLLLLAKSE